MFKRILFTVAASSALVACQGAKVQTVDPTTGGNVLVSDNDLGGVPASFAGTWTSPTGNCSIQATIGDSTHPNGNYPNCVATVKITEGVGSNGVPTLAYNVTITDNDSDPYQGNVFNSPTYGVLSNALWLGKSRIGKIGRAAFTSNGGNAVQFHLDSVQADGSGAARIHLSLLNETINATLTRGPMPTPTPLATPQPATTPDPATDASSDTDGAPN